MRSTRALRALPIDLPPNDSMITWARLLGSAWVLLGLYFSLRAGELLGIARVPLVFALLLVAFVPVYLHAATIANPDVTALTAGAAVLWAAVAWQRKPVRRSLVWLCVASAVAILLDDTNGVAVILAVVYLAIVSLQGIRNDPKWRARARPIAFLTIAVLGAGVVAKYSWNACEWLLLEVIGRNGVDTSRNPAIDLYTLKGPPTILTFFGPDRIFGLFPPVLDPTPPTFRREPLYDGFGQAAFFLAVGAVAGRTLWAKLTDRMDALATATTVALLTGGPITAIYFYVTANVATRPTGRFGLSALPAVALVIAATARGPVGRALLGFVSIGLAISAVLVLF